MFVKKSLQKPDPHMGRLLMPPTLAYNCGDTRQLEPKTDGSGRQVAPGSRPGCLSNVGQQGQAGNGGAGNREILRDPPPAKSERPTGSDAMQREHSIPSVTLDKGVRRPSCKLTALAIFRNTSHTSQGNTGKPSRREMHQVCAMHSADRNPLLQRTMLGREQVRRKAPDG